jgi:hypothetical protein
MQAVLSLASTKLNRNASIGIEDLRDAPRVLRLGIARLGNRSVDIAITVRSSANLGPSFEASRPVGPSAEMRRVQSRFHRDKERYGYLD